MNIYDWQLRTRTLLKENHPQLAKKLITEGQALFTDAEGRATAALLLGDWCEARFKKQEAAEHYAQAVQGFRGIAYATENLVRALIQQGAMLHAIGQMPQAIPCFDEAIALCERDAQHDDLCRALRSAGFNHYLLGNYELAMQLTERALQTAREHSLTAREAEALRNLAGMHWDAGHDDVALDYNLQSLHQAKASNNQWGMGTTLNNMALLHLSRHDHARCLQCLNEAALLPEHLKDIHLHTMQIRSKLYRETGQLQQALETAQQCTVLATAIHSEKDVASSLQTQSKILLRLNRPAEALPLQQQCLARYTELKIRDCIVTAHQHLGRIYTALNQFDEAFENLHTALQLAQKDGLAPFLMEAHELLSALYEKYEQPHQALEHFKQAFEQRKKIFTTESESEMNRLKVQFETEKKERELALLRKEREEQERPAHTAQQGYRLSPREHAILKLLSQGLSYKLTAARLGISFETAREHIANLYKKLGVSTNTEAVAKGVKEGLV